MKVGLLILFLPCLLKWRERTNEEKIIILNSFLIGAIFVLVIFTTSQQSMINNEAIQVEELIVYGDKNMNRVAKQFSDQNNLTSFGKNFWRKTYNGKSPAQELLKVAMEDLVQHKMIRQLATELEIAHSQTFGQEKRMARPKEQFNALAIFRCKRSTITGPNKREINGERKANAKRIAAGL